MMAISIKRIWLVACFAVLAVFFVVAWPVRAQNTSPEQAAVKYGVQFPVAELGNCGSVAGCRSYCEDPVNAAVCVTYAKSKGFYKEEEVDVKKKEGLLEKAKAQLGCDSHETCKSFCQIPDNFSKCDAFAKKQGITGGQVEDPQKKEILQKAKEVLGCDSYATCASFCADDTNRQKCSEFAKESGLRGGERPVGPGGCTSAESCKAFCSSPDNYQVCSGFVSSNGGKFQGPGGCDSQDSCRSYCERNPQNCVLRNEGGVGTSVPSKYDPQEMCNRTPACSWKDNACQCGSFNSEEGKGKADEYVKICRETPQRCTPGGIGGVESRQDRAVFEKFCRENPEKCRPAYYDMMGGRNYDPAQECTKYAGCAWTGRTCQCGTRYEVSAPGTSPSSYEKGCTPGYYWDGNKCVEGKNEGSGWSDSGAREKTWCQPPSSGCGVDSFWDYTYCSCNKRSGGSSGTTTPGGSGSTTSSGSENYNNIYSGGRPGGPGAPYPGESSSGGGAYGGGYDAQGKYVGGSYGGYDSAGNYVGTGSQGGSSGGSSSGSGGSNTSTVPVQSTAPAPQPQQQTETTPAPQPAQESQPAPQPAQESQPAPQPAQETTTTTTTPAVQGISTVRDLLSRILDLFR